MKHLGDITKISGYEIEPVDCVTGGSPCQDLSIAGKRVGLAGERSGLFMEQVRVVKELRNADRLRGRTGNLVRPRFMVWENVPGVFSSNGGRDFQAVLSEIVRVAESDAPDVPLPEKWPLADAYFGDGWSVAYRVHDAQFWGVPQRRRRIALVADFGGHAAPEVLFERESVSWNSEPRGAAREETAGGAGSGACGAISFQERTGKPGGGKGVLIKNERTGALSTLNNQSVFTHDARGNGDGKTACTLTGDHQDRVMDYTALCVGNGQLHQISMAKTANTLDTMHDQQAVFCFQNTGRGWWNESDVGATVRTPCGGDSTKANLVSAVDCRNGTENKNINGTLQAKGNGGNSLNLNNVCRQGPIVRRLTPLECERLQGYPDGWTDIGEWTDSKGKRHMEADSPRYKALGNSIALPFWFWLLRRISALYEQPATLGSLFDGLGGFPLCWERCNGRGTARWASEIEEFPIAVTKRHFGDEGAGVEGDLVRYL